MRGWSPVIALGKKIDKVHISPSILVYEDDITRVISYQVYQYTKEVHTSPSILVYEVIYDQVY